MIDPVIAADGYTYERTAMQQWLQMQSTSPVTLHPLLHTRLVPSILIKTVIQSHMGGSALLLD